MNKILNIKMLFLCALVIVIISCTQESPQGVPEPYLKSLTITNTTNEPIGQIDFGTDGPVVLMGENSPIADILLKGGGLVDGSSNVNRCRVRKNNIEYIDYCSIHSYASNGSNASVYLWLITGDETGEYLISVKRDDLPWSNELSVTVH